MLSLASCSGRFQAKNVEASTFAHALALLVKLNLAKVHQVFRFCQDSLMVIDCKKYSVLKFERRLSVPRLTEKMVNTTNLFLCPRRMFLNVLLKDNLNCQHSAPRSPRFRSKTETAFVELV